MMKIAQITPYIYLILSALFIYDAIDKYTKNEHYIISIAFAAVGIFMFFFRLRFLKKIKKQQEQQNK
jgi:cytochrome c biogenesis protein CcdA